MQDSKQERFQDKIQSIYDILLKLKFPFLEDDIDISSQQEQLPSKSSGKQIMMKIGKFIQGTQSRLLLLEWLVNLYKPNKCNSKLAKTIRIENLVRVLDTMGMLPISKHTKNMDYNKYVEGLLGFQSSIILVFRTCNFIKRITEIRKRDKADTKIVSMTKELAQNRHQLVNIQHDPFGIIFPEGFKHLSEQQFNQKYHQFLFRLQNRQEQNKNKVDTNIDDSFLNISKDTKQRFRTTMIQLIEMSRKIRQQDVPKYEEPERSRLLDMDGQFVNIFRKFIKFITFEEEKSQTYLNERKEVDILLQKL